MREKLLRGGAIAYFWAPPTWAAKRDCIMHAEPLGVDYSAAKRRCDEVLNPQLDAWRTGLKVVTSETGPVVGTFDWMVADYKTAPKYLERPPKVRKSYDAALSLVSKYKLKDGRTLGSLSLLSITEGIADLLFAKLRVRADGTDRNRTAVLCMVVSKVAWNVARRRKSDVVPLENPFAGMDLSVYKPKPTRPVTHFELQQFVAAADAAGEPTIATAALIAFHLLQREADILSRLSWTHYRPAEDPDFFHIFHHKTGELVRMPLFDQDGTNLFPEITARLDSATRLGTLIVMRNRPDRRRKIHLPWEERYFRRRVQEIREAAGIDANVKFMGLRHGGNTEGADAGLTDAQLTALSGHRSATMVRLYAKKTTTQRQIGARKRLEVRTKRGNLSE